MNGNYSSARLRQRPPIPAMDALPQLLYAYAHTHQRWCPWSLLLLLFPTREAVWQAIGRLRKKGLDIRSHPDCGYELRSPDRWELHWPRHGHWQVIRRRPPEGD